MAGRIALDTSVLIDLQRERAREGGDGPAHRFLASDPDLELHLPAPALGEFAEGFDDDDHPVLRAVRELHVLLAVDERTSLIYGRVTRTLRGRGRLIGTNDLWIAACCLRHDLALVTADERDFAQVDELRVQGYR